ncbi:MAG: hypothetical protein LBS27_06575 [Bifidobacteriaceae bacterium]|jgi:formamidopyrimidine-DNA glycosylase|nr:hypothetical protein [Bifidobacteriaceae bacterium]
MPELPEVETVRRGLERLIVGRTIAGIEAIEPSSLTGVAANAVGQPVTGLRRRGKVLVIDLDKGISMVAHLKMTGQLVLRSPAGAASGPTATSKPTGDHAAAASAASNGPTGGTAGAPVAAPPRRQAATPALPGVSPTTASVPNSGAAGVSPIGTAAIEAGEAWGGGHPSDSLIGPLPDNSTRVVIRFTDGSRLYFNDQRKFGWLAVMPTAEVGAIPLLAKMGPEPFGPQAWPEFRRRARRHRRAPIKAVLLDQAVVAGIGNIYADEALWAARIHPETPIGALSDPKLKELLIAAGEVMDLSLKLGGSTDRNYVDAEGRRGAYLDFAQVFRRQGRPCARCDTTIIKTRVAGRGTHLCPRCQRRRQLPAPPAPKATPPPSDG